MMVFWLKMVAEPTKEKKNKKQQEEGLEISERREEVSMESGLKCGSFFIPENQHKL